MKIIPQWRQALKMYSVQAQSLALAVLGGWQALPDDLRASMPQTVVLGVAMVLLVLGIVGRLIAQPGIEPAPIP